MQSLSSEVVLTTISSILTSIFPSFTQESISSNGGRVSHIMAASNTHQKLILFFKYLRYLSQKRTKPEKEDRQTSQSCSESLHEDELELPAALNLSGQER